MAVLREPVICLISYHKLIITFALISVCVAILSYGLINGIGIITIYPSINFSFTQIPVNIYYFVFIVLLSPLIFLEIREVIQWR